MAIGFEENDTAVSAADPQIARDIEQGGRLQSRMRIL